MNKQYKVYNKQGEYHHVYSASLEGALGWAIDCAKRVGGSVTAVQESEKETASEGKRFEHISAFYTETK